MKIIFSIALVLYYAFSSNAFAANCKPVVANGKVKVEIIDASGRSVYSENHEIRNDKKYSGFISSSKMYNLLQYDKSGKIKREKSKVNIASGGTTTKFAKNDGSAVAKIGGCPLSEINLFTRLGKQKQPFVHSDVFKGLESASLVSTTAVGSTNQNSKVAQTSSENTSGKNGSSHNGKEPVKLENGWYLINLGGAEQYKAEFFLRFPDKQYLCTRHPDIVIEDKNILLDDKVVDLLANIAKERYRETCNKFYGGTHIQFAFFEKSDYPNFKSPQQLASVTFHTKDIKDPWHSIEVLRRNHVLHFHKIAQQQKVAQDAKAKKRNDARKKQRSFSEKHNVDNWVSVRDLNKNPFVYDGVTIAVALKLEKMIKRNVALMKGLGKFAGSIDYNDPVIVVNVPKTVSMSPNGSVVAVRVIESDGKYTASTNTAYYLDFKAAAECGQRRCKDYQWELN